ncbi:hypothetical protein AJ78_08010 [Emergomyces pasteurianus Ep9510]|uniref:Glycoprotein X n=1 Tax=Emergomyces pasteurianus Ep9510 TaxID=1447872 RepID=A0A1J9P473_9EURO|nr:hypothetical protein AJ78_08010 [Emergomyces pasteurianus Ep9510]
MIVLLSALIWSTVCLLPANCQNDDHIGIKVGLNIGDEPSAGPGTSGHPALIDIDAAILISWCNSHTRSCPSPGYPVMVTVTDTVTENRTITVPTTTTETTVTTVRTTTTETTVTTVATTTTETTVTTLPGSTIVTTTTTTAPGETVTSIITIPGSDTTDTVTNTVTHNVTPCPSLTVNPTFTPSVPYPTNYRWGCPPGKLCKPYHRKENGHCNAEIGLPAEEYFCSPEECIPNTPIIPQYWGKPGVSNETGKWVLSDHYYSLDPRTFGLDFDIFVFPNSSYGTQPPPYGTRTLAERQITVRAPQPCFDDCNNAYQESQRGLDISILCINNSTFQKYVRNCGFCIGEHAKVPNPLDIVVQLEGFEVALNICADQPTETSSPPAQSTTTPSTTPSQTPSETSPTEPPTPPTPSETAKSDSFSDSASQTTTPTATPTGGGGKFPSSPTTQPSASGSLPPGWSPTQPLPTEFPGAANVINIPPSKYSVSAITVLAIVLTLF